MKALLLILGLAAVLSLGAQSAIAGHRSAGSADRFVAQRSLSAEDAAALVQARTGGRVLSVDTVRRGNRVFYRVKVLTSQGEVRIFMVDAETGAL